MSLSFWEGCDPSGLQTRKIRKTGREVGMAFLSPSKITTMEHARKHRTWALWIMVIVYIFNFIDRQIVNILQEDIKADLGLLDWQLGTMTGLTFAIVYCTFGIPVARIADSTSRKGVMAISLALPRSAASPPTSGPCCSPAWASASARQAAARPPMP
jgi:hypothetical protein